MIKPEFRLGSDKEATDLSLNSSGQRNYLFSASRSIIRIYVASPNCDMQTATSHSIDALPFDTMQKYHHNFTVRDTV